MKKKIFKYIINNKQTIISIPKDSLFLSCQNQNNNIVIWYMVDESYPIEEKMFELFMTGEEIHFDMGVERNFISTIQLGYLVYHIFERIN